MPNPHTKTDTHKRKDRLQKLITNEISDENYDANERSYTKNYDTNERSYTKNYDTNERSYTKIYDTNERS